MSAMTAKFTVPASTAIKLRRYNVLMGALRLAQAIANVTAPEVDNVTVTR